MSEENVEIVRRGWELFLEGMERGDFGPWFDLEEVADDLEWVPIPGLGLGPYRGREGFDEFMRIWTTEFEQVSFELERMVDAGEDRVVCVFRQTATGTGSGIPVELRQGGVWEFEDGRVVRITLYATPDEALEAAGVFE